VRRIDGRLSYQQETYLELQQAQIVGCRSRTHGYCDNNHLDLSVRSVDRGALERALGAVVRRHESLRTAFDGHSTRVTPWVAPVVALADASDAADPIECARRLAVDAVMRPFSYDGDLLCRATLIRISNDEELFVVVVPHLVSDGASIARVLKQELQACYAHETGAGPPPPPVANQYSDFVHWQRQWLGIDARADLIRYYEARIARASAATIHRGPTLREQRTWKSASVAIQLSDSATAAVHTMSWRARVAPIVLLLAIYQIAVHIWSGQDDTLIAIPLAARRDMNMADLIGFFACHGVIRSSVHGDPTFGELLTRVATSVREAYANQGTPYGALVEIARERGDPDPPMTLCMNVHRLPADSDETHSFRATPVPLEPYGVHQLMRWDMNLLLRQLSTTAIAGWLMYGVDVLDKPAARTYVRQFLALVDAATSSPNSRISVIARAASDAAASSDSGVLAADTVWRDAVV